MIYKNTFFGVLLFFLTVQMGFAQKEKPASTLNTIFESSKDKIRFYGGPLVEYSKFIGQNALFVGGKGGAIFNKKFGIGFVLKGKTTRNSFVGNHNNEQKDMRISSRLGGIFVEYIYELDKAIHFNAVMNFLWGRNRVLTIKETTTTTTVTNGSGSSATTTKKETLRSKDDIVSSNMFGVEPKLGVELNFTKFMIVNLNVGYRYISYSQKLLDFTLSDFNGITAGINFKFGRF